MYRLCIVSNILEQFGKTAFPLSALLHIFRQKLSLYGRMDGSPQTYLP